MSMGHNWKTRRSSARFRCQRSHPGRALCARFKPAGGQGEVRVCVKELWMMVHLELQVIFQSMEAKFFFAKSFSKFLPVFFLILLESNDNIFQESDFICCFPFPVDLWLEKVS